MSDDRARLRKIAGNLSEDDRKAQLSKASEVRKDIEETLGNDVVRQDVLVRIAWNIWSAVPVNEKAKYTADEWRHAIYNKCSSVLEAAEDRISNGEGDQRLVVAKIKLLRQGFAKQVHRAMEEIANMQR